ncbi:MAG: class I poly(R)-hydroxyalkanoic acid synthase [Rhodocyclaceae bacterium]|nr:class I poly(R)-hydroxyalkanoic acid synthase [Rhodocyclaceae bacterium]
MTQSSLPPLIASDALLALQREWQAKHAELWRAMLFRAKDAPAPTLVEPPPNDRRFAHPSWGESPLFDYLRQAYLLNAQYLMKMASAAPAPNEKAKKRLEFATRQLIDAIAPSNFAATNPEFIAKALATQGESIRQGIQNLIADLAKGRITMSDESAFEVGRNLAVTPGAVVFENALIQLIQYAPLTEEVAKRPLLIVPPCINKFYILDLQPENSFVRYALTQGHTVFMISWRNPNAELGHLTWDDYLEQGPLAAFDVVREIAKTDQINALGFCVGGTLLASALAVAKARGDDVAASLTLLTTFLDFSDTGEIGLLVDEETVAAREATIGKGGLLTAKELSATFSMLRANDLIWPYVVGNYLKGETPPAFDLLYWNADSTNLPGPFSAWYLRHLYLENSLRTPNKLAMCGVRVDLSRLQAPAFILATREDHIVPWRSAYLSRHVLGGNTTFVLGASGHIAGVINPPAKNKRSHWINEAMENDADAWLAGAQEIPGSWWPRWSAWLAQHAGGKTRARTRLGAKKYPPSEPAPGRYVKERA